MPEAIDLDAVLEQQPQIDPEELKAARELRERLRNRHRQYQLVPPFGGRRVRRIDPSTLNPFIQNPDPLPDRDRS
jgi:hypothetical protein